MITCQSCGNGHKFAKKNVEGRHPCQRQRTAAKQHGGKWHDFEHPPDDVEIARAVLEQYIAGTAEQQRFCQTVV